MEHTGQLEREKIGFMDLPPEIRGQIYPLALDILGYKGWYINFASTCHQIRLEALPLALQQMDLSRKGFEKLLQWVRAGTPQHLAMIQTLRINLWQDCFQALEESPRHAADLCKFVPTTGSLFQRRYGGRFNPHGRRRIVGGVIAWSETKSPNTIADTFNSLAAFANVESLLLLLDDPYKYPYPAYKPKILFRPEKELVLEMLPTAFPKLLNLTIASTSLRPLYLKRFQNLRHLSCSAYFQSTPEKILSILRSLKHLVSISLVQPNHGVSSQEVHLIQRPSYASKHPLSITPEVLSQLNPLESFEIISQGLPGYRVVHFTAPIMKALQPHLDSLRELNVDERHCEYLPESRVVDILDFVYTCSIPDLSLAFTFPTRLTTVPAEHFVPPKTGRDIDVLSYTNWCRGNRAVLTVRSGKYLPSTTEIEERESLYTTRSGQTILHIAQPKSC